MQNARFFKNQHEGTTAAVRDTPWYSHTGSPSRGRCLHADSFLCGKLLHGFMVSPSTQPHHIFLQTFDSRKKNSLSKQNTAIEQLPLLMKVRGILLAWTVRNKSLMYLIIDLKTLFCSCTEAQNLNKVFCNGSKFLLNIQSGEGKYCQC